MLLAIGVPGATAAPPSDPGAFGRSHRPVCGAAPRGAGRCLSEVVTDAQGDPLVTPAPDWIRAGRPPERLRPVDAGELGRRGQTIAIVDAYDDPNAEADLAVYRSQYGLPPCTTANGCFRKVDQQRRHRTTRPPTPAGRRRSRSTSTWSRRSAPTARSCWSRPTRNAFADLGAAVDRGRHARRHLDLQLLRRQRVLAARPRDDEPLQPPGRRGHRQLGRQRLRRRVPGGLAVRHGGRRHRPAPRRRHRPRLDRDGLVAAPGSGCSAYDPKPAWQTDTGCAKRTVADVSAVADPNTGVAVYDSYLPGSSGWMVFGGTSASSPIVAGVRRPGRPRRPPRRPTPTPTLRPSTTSRPATTATATAATCHRQVGLRRADGPGYAAGQRRNPARSAAHCGVHSSTYLPGN